MKLAKNLTTAIIFSTAALLANAAVANPPASEKVAADASNDSPRFSVSVKGADTLVASEPLELWQRGEQPSSPSFDRLFEAAASHSVWTVVSIKDHPTRSRLLLKSDDGSMTMGMDLAKTMMDFIKVTPGAKIKMEREQKGSNALVKLMYGKIPLGFSLNEGTSIQN